MPTNGRHDARLALAGVVASATGALSRTLGRGGGTTVPGRALIALDPRAIAKLGRRLEAGSVVVSATNGKTTTSAMLAGIAAQRWRLAHNGSGANLASGVAASLLEASDAELGVFEVDEEALPAMLLELEPRAVALGNLFRDQLDRYGELEHLAEGWHAAIAALPPEVKVVVNADDPVLAEVARERPGATFFGLDDPSASIGRLSHAVDSATCPVCGEELLYEAIYGGHLGDWRCPDGHRARPELDLAARSIELDGLRRSTFDLDAGEGRCRLELPVGGLYNVYNALSAAALARALGVGLAEIAASLQGFEAAFGRLERVAVDERTALLLLIKNPAGANEVVRTLVDAGGRPIILAALNDEIADGRDVSWIWDVDYEPLLPTIERLVVSGSRAEELALRFTYGGLAPERVEVVHDLGEAFDTAIAHTPVGEELAVLPTYTAMLALQRILAERGLSEPYWRRS